MRVTEGHDDLRMVVVVRRDITQSHAYVRPQPERTQLETCERRAALSARRSRGVWAGEFRRRPRQRFDARNGPDDLELDDSELDRSHFRRAKATIGRAATADAAAAVVVVAGR